MIPDIRNTFFDPIRKLNNNLSLIHLLTYLLKEKIDKVVTGREIELLVKENHYEEINS